MSRSRKKYPSEEDYSSEEEEKDEEKEENEDEENEGKELEQEQEKAIKEKWAEQSKKLQPTSAHIYILTLESNSEDRSWQAEFNVIGAFDSLNAAVAKSITIETDYGKFDDAINDIFSSKFDHIDNRKNPPEDGILVQLGGNDVGEGGYCRLLITKKPILHILETAIQMQKENKRAAQSQRNIRQKKKKVDFEDSDDGDYSESPL